MLSAEITLKIQFYDIDSMRVAWHGNYVRYLEEARCALLDLIGYNYVEMSKSGYLWPVVDLRIKYIRPLRFAQQVKVRSRLVEYENRLCIDYRIVDAPTGETLTKARTVQLAVDAKTEELCFTCPPALVDKVRALL